MIKSFKIETAASRAALIGAALVCLAAAFFFAAWCFANVMAARAVDREVAELAAAIAPNDPQTHYALAVLTEKTFSAETLTKSREEFGLAAALSPHDYRLWLAYGKSLERGGDSAGAEIALRQALKLAPNYAAVQWTLGNVLVRGGKSAEGFAEIRRAAESDAPYRLPAIVTAWEIFGGDYESVRRAVGDSPNLSSTLAVFLARQKRPDDAAEVWSALPAADKKTVYKADGEQILAELLATRKYRKAVEIQNDINENAAEKFAVGKIYNAGFELELARQKAGVFDWQIADGQQPQIGPNIEQKRGGERSIFMIFNSGDGRDFRQISQNIAVESARKYVFSGFYKSNLKTAATFRWEIVDTATAAVLAVTNPMAANADWTNVSIAFTTPEKTEAVILRLTRESCKSIICPISGNVWFDDFSLDQ